MDYLQDLIDLRRSDIDPELFAVALAIRYFRRLINQGGSDIGHPDLESAMHPEHLESFLARAVEIAWEDTRLAHEWRNIKQVLPRVKVAWEKGQSLFREALKQAKSDKKSMEYFSMIDFAVDCYAEVFSSRAYPDSPAWQNWSINGYMSAWRGHFLEVDGVEGESMD